MRRPSKKIEPPALFEKLFYGFNNVNETLKNIQAQQVSRTVIVPVSTRAAGFIIRNLMVKFLQLNVIDQPTAINLGSALYRVTLLQLDLKLEEAMLLQHSRNLGLTSYEDVYVTSDQRRALELMGTNFSPLVNYISSLGYIKTAAKCYLPRIPKVNTNRADYLHQHFSKLRTTVEALANVAEVNEQKRAFMDNCPFPTAVWTVTEAGLVNLANPETIIPANYGIANVRNDIALIAANVEKIGRKYPEI